MRLFIVVFGGGLLAAALAVACSTTDGGGSEQIIACRDTFTMCALDPMPSLAQSQECTAALDGPCGNAGLIYRSCVTGLCTDAGFTDYGALGARCNNDQVSFQDCLDALDASAASTGAGGEDASVKSTPMPTATSTGGPTPVPPAADASAPIDAAAPLDAASPADGGSDAAR